MLNIQSLEKIPIPLPTEINQEKINLIVEKILYNRKHGIITTDFESHINQIIYDIFQFARNEIEFIESL